MLKKELVPDIDRVNQEKLKEILKNSCPELYFIYEAINETQIEPRLIIEFVFQLRNVLDSGWGKVWVDVMDKKAVFVQATKRVKLNFDE